MVNLLIPGGEPKTVHPGTSFGEIAESFGPAFAKTAIAAAYDGRIYDLGQPLPDSTEASHELRFLTNQDPDALGVLRHSTAHILGCAIIRLFPGTRLGFGPATEAGFYYDVDPGERPLTEEDFPAIEAEMAKIIKDNRAFERFELPTVDARDLTEQLGESYKVEHIRDELGKFDHLSFYRLGEFIDLCRGPHLPATGKVGAFKLMSIAGAYWKAQTDRKMLQRVYGTAFFDKESLKAHLDLIEEAKKRDHRKIGRDLNLFTISPLVGSGLILWMPKGATVRGLLEAFLKDELVKRGYQPVYTPHIGKIDLYKTSGHYPYYKSSQFPPIRLPDDAAMELIDGLENQALDDEAQRGLLRAAGIKETVVEKVGSAEAPGERRLSYFDLDPAGRVKYVQAHGAAEEYLLKPMNCPHHIQIYAAQPRSYRDLPLRLAEFGTVYRYEQSGELSGLTRVRGFTQDDAHLFCTPDQVREEFRSTIELTQFVFNSLGLVDYQLRLSKSDPNDKKYQGADYAVWARAEADIRSVLDEMKLPYVEAEGEAAFYGPKVDFVVHDAIGRKWQLGTVQLDYVLPERFGLTFTGPDNLPHRPVMIHRAPFGSMERFMGILIEHFAGAFPFWLAPEQVRLMTISEKFVDYAQHIATTLRMYKLRVEADYRPEKIGAKVRDAQLAKVPVMLVIGAKEVESGTVSYRDRVAGDLGSISIDEVIRRLNAENANRSLPASAPRPAEGANPATSHPVG